MWPDRLVDLGTAGEAPHDPPGGVPVEAFAVADLERFKDLRGVARPWFFTVAGTSQTFRAEEVIGEPAGEVFLQITEKVVSASAPPLVEPTELGADVARFTFDLYRIGDFVAEVTPLAEGAGPWAGTLRLVDPDGSEIGRDDDGLLRCAISVPHLARSRDATTCAPRPWVLEDECECGAAIEVPAP